jgi:hypothetical protein
MSNEYEELKRRVDALEGELAEAKKALEAIKPAEEKPFKLEKPWQKPDYTANFGMPASAVKAMCAVVPEMKDRSQMSDVRRPQYSEPGGFGSPSKPTRAPEVQRGSGWENPRPLEGRVNEDQIKKRWSP